MVTRTIRAFLFFHLLPRGRCQARWIARGTGTELYRSKPCASKEEAERLAKKWLEKNGAAWGVVDTTKKHETWDDG